jgi:hypothetical protein
MEATITSVEPRAFHATADRERLGSRQSAEATTDEGSEELADTRERDETDGEPQEAWLGERGDIDGEAHEGEEHRHEEADDESAQLGAKLPGEHRRLSEQHPGDERTEHEMDAEHVGEQRQQTGDHEDGGDVGHLAGESVVRPAKDAEHQPAAEGEAQDEKQRDTEDAVGNAGDVEGTAQRQTERDRQDDPADGVVEDRCGDDDLSDRAAQESQLAHDQRHDLYRGNRQRGAEEERRDQAPLRVRQHGIGQERPEQAPAEEWHDDAAERHGDGRATRIPEHRQVGLHPRNEQQQQDPQLRDCIQHGLLLRDSGKQPVPQLRRQRSENRRPEQHAGDDLSGHRRLTQALHQLASEAPAGEQHHQLGDEYCDRRSMRHTHNAPCKSQPPPI